MGPKYLLYSYMEPLGPGQEYTYGAFEGFGGLREHTHKAFHPHMMT